MKNFLYLFLCIAVIAACSKSDGGDDNKEVPVASVELNKASLELAIGGSETLSAIVSPTEATDKAVTWSSSNSNIATVDNTGKVVAVAVGNVTIMARAGGKTALCEVTVVDYIIFADHTVEDICLSKFDTNNDGRLSYAEAASVTSFDGGFGDKSRFVISFDELQYFTSLKSVGFGTCEKLTSIILPESIETIITGGFKECKRLKSINIPPKVTSLGTQVFDGCESFEEVILPDGFKGMGLANFAGCKNVKTFNIPESVDNIGDGNFARCARLERFTGKYASSDGKCLIFRGKMVGFAPYGLTEYTILSEVDVIGENALDSCALERVYIPNTVSNVECSAFERCYLLREFNGKFASADKKLLIINNVVTAFAQYNISSYTIPDGVTEIGRHAFIHCENLRELHLPASITRISKFAFLHDKLTSLYIEATTPPIIDDIGLPDDTTVYVPASSVEDYKTSEYWKQYAQKIVAYSF